MNEADFKNIRDRIHQAQESGETDTRLGKALVKWNFDIPVERDGRWLLEGFIMEFQKQREILSAIDPTISPDLPPHLLDPVHIAHFFCLPMEELDWPGIRVRSDAVVLQKLSGIEKLVQLMQQAHSPIPDGVALGPTAGLQADPKEKWLTLRQCADLSGRSTSTIRRAMRGGVLKVHNVGSGRKRPSYRVRADELQQYIEAGRVGVPDPPTISTTKVTKKSRHFD